MPMPVDQKTLRTAKYERRSYFVDPAAIRRARKALGVATDAETVRLAIERVVAMEEFRRFMLESRATLGRGSIEAP